MIKLKNLRKKFFEFYKLCVANPFITSLVFILIIWISIPEIVYFYENGVQGSNIQSKEDAHWWGIVTLMTVGYGDKYPITTIGRIWAGVLMIGGVAAIGVVTAKISSVFLEKALRERRGLVDSDSLKNHFIICGWKNDMHTFLLHILESNEELTAEKIVLVNNVSDGELDALHEFPSLKKIKIIKGDFFNADVLKRAAPERAKKVVIVADSTPGPKGAIPTRSEADARTVMTAMTVNNIAKGTPVAAEILDSNMDQYLRLAQVHEIIYSREYSRLMLAMASTGTGVTNIIHDLLSPQSEVALTTKEITADFIGKTYKDFKDHFVRQFPSYTLLGILENSGNSHQAKETALKKAQQTPNIAELVRNLQEVKSLRFNHPLFSPAADYKLMEGAMAIVIMPKLKRGNHGQAFI